MSQPAGASLPSAGDPRYHPSDDGAVPEAERQPEPAYITELRELVQAQAAELARIQAERPPEDVPARVVQPFEDGSEARRFPRGTLVEEVHEYDRLVALQRLQEKGLARAEAPLPEGSVTVDLSEFRPPA